MVRRAGLWFVNVFVVATCGLIYELLAGTVASYLLGDSVTQFSLVIGLYLSALGVGAWTAQYVGSDLGRRFIAVELSVALLGGFSAPLLLLAFPFARHFQALLLTLVFLVGVLVGLELPLLLRLLRDELEFDELISKALTFDYLGALVASLLFPLFLVPRLGLVRTSLLFGFLNASVGLWATFLLAPVLEGRLFRLRVWAGVVLALLTAGLFSAKEITRLAEEFEFGGEILSALTTPYQRIVVSRCPNGFLLFLNNHLQFDSRDEYRYHEALVHPAMQAHGAPERVLVLGGGDGLALRELLKYPSVREATLVDIDPEMTGLSSSLGPLAELNAHSFSDPRVHVVHEDAMAWVGRASGPFDVAIVDFPDPSNYAVSKLFTRQFYRSLKQRLAPAAAVAVQCTSPLFARRSYWCILRTLEAAGFVVRPYQATVPSFSVWGFALARLRPFERPTSVPPGLRFLDEATLASLFVLGPDLESVPVEINRLDNQMLVHYYEEEWGRLR
ncbi:MAG: polyamine aminopropyltransferase [Planctomycetes bacterium]|nr:polyamine aminopropyltransferase [Planctomycetota bacterium]